MKGLDLRSSPLSFHGKECIMKKKPEKEAEYWKEQLFKLASLAEDLIKNQKNQIAKDNLKQVLQKIELEMEMV